MESKVEQTSPVYTAATEKRVLAYLFDSLVTGIFFIPAWMQALGSYIDDEMIAMDWQWLVACQLMAFLYHWLFLYFLGATLGKLFFGLRVVPYHHPEKELGLMQSFLRVLTDELSFFFGEALKAVAFLRFDRTHVSDWVAETRVVQMVTRRRLPIRRKGLAVIVIIFSGWNSFAGAYQFIQNARWIDEKVVLDWSMAQSHNDNL